MTETPEGYLGAEGRLGSGPSEALVAAGYELEINDAWFLHRGLGLADLAHVLELEEIGLISAPVGAELCREILDIQSIPPDQFPYDPTYGDAYNSRERELERRLGSLAGWIPTGRTRREAGRVALRIALRQRLLDLHTVVADFAVHILRRSQENAAVLWNDTTYLQPAQPSTFGHYLAGFAEETIRDLGRIRECFESVNVSPAGSGGVAGTQIPLDRARLAARLGFDKPTSHTRDGMWSADVIIDVTMAAAQAVLTADRLAEDLEIFASPQFGYVTLAGSVSRASVLLPQKRNPYALSVIRGGAGTLIGRVAGMLAMQRTPSARTDNWLYAYGEVIGSLEMAKRLVRLASEVVNTMQIDSEALAASAGDHFASSADMAEWLVIHHKLDYRTAYRLIGRAVARVPLGRKLQAEDLSAAAAELSIAAHDFGEAVEAVEETEQLVANRDSSGGSAPHRLEEHRRFVETRLDTAREWAAKVESGVVSAEEGLLAAAERAVRSLKGN